MRSPMKYAIWLTVTLTSALAFAQARRAMMEALAALSRRLRRTCA